MGRIQTHGLTAEKKMTIEIKKMETDAEIKGKAFVHWKSWHETYAGLVDPAYLETVTPEKCETLAYRWRDGILIAKDRDKVVGFAGCGKARDDESGSTGEVFAIYVLGDYIGRGVGYRLMQAALDQLKAYDRIGVWVLKDNERAIRFYKRCGFRSDGQEKAIMLGTEVKEIRMILDRSGANGSPDPGKAESR